MVFSGNSMEDLEQNWRKLSLSEREGPGYSLTKDDGVHAFSIAAKFFTKRALSIDVIAKTFTPLWRSRNGFKIKYLGDHKILFTFDEKTDVDRILMSEPWSFDKHLVAMERYEKEIPLHELKFEKTSLWVQIHGIPLKYMTVAVAEKICEVIGDVLRPKDPKDADGGSFLRLKISIDLSLPLCRGRLVTLENDKQVWVSFKYERLPNLCYWCGRLNHVDKDCAVWIESEGTLRPDERQFGPSLRAPAYVPSRKTEIQVPGFYTEKKKAGPSTPNHKATDQAVGNLSVMEGFSGGIGTEGGETQADGGHGPAGNGNALKSTNLGPKITHGNHYGINQDIMSESVFPAQHAAHLNESNVEVAEPNQYFFPALNSLHATSRAPTCLPVTSKETEARDNQEAARATKDVAPLRVLPKWSRRVRDTNSSARSEDDLSSGQKRAAPDIDIGFDLPYKRQQVYQRVSEDILEVVEADHQPRQEP